MPKSQKEMNTELMLSIHHNLLTAKQAVNNVIDKITDNALKRELKAQFKDYDGLSEACEDLARVYEIELTDNTFFKKAKMWINVNMSMLMDKSNTNIACINIIGSTMGVLDLMKVLADSKKCKKEIVNLAKSVLSLEERNIEKLKPYVYTESEKMREKTEPETNNNPKNLHEKKDVEAKKYK